MNSKTLIIYATHEISENLIYFCRNGYIDDPKYDFVIVFNNPLIKLAFFPNKNNIKVVTRENIGNDFGGWIHVLFSKDDNNNYLYLNYEYFIFINSTVRGPFLPQWYDQQKYGYWPELYIAKLNDDVKLVGPIINMCYAAFNFDRYVQSSFFVTDRIGIDIGIKNKIFDLNNIHMDKYSIVVTKELGLSKAIINEGYNIACMLPNYNNVDFRIPIDDLSKKKSAFEPCSPNGYFDININPYEVMFIKINRNITPLLIQKYTEWTIKKFDTDSIVKILYGLSIDESIDVTEKMVIYLKDNLYFDMKFDVNRYIGDPYPNKSKNIIVYTKDESIIVGEFASKLLFNLIFL